MTLLLVPHIQTWNEVADSFPVFSGLILLEDEFPAYETTTMGVTVKPDRFTVVQETPEIVVEPYWILNGSLSADSVPDVRIEASVSPKLSLAPASVVEPVPRHVTGIGELMPVWNSR